MKPSSYISGMLYNDSTQYTLKPEEWIIVRKIVNGVKRVSPLLAKKRRCLMQALIVFSSLKQVGINSSIKLGAQSAGKTVTTHAWVSIGNKIIIGGALSGYEELIRIH